MTWYLRRLSAMSATEVVHRLLDTKNQRRWISKPPDEPIAIDGRVRLAPPEVFSNLASINPDVLLDTAENLLAGHWTVLGVERCDVTANVDYYRDPKSGVIAPSSQHAFRIDHRDEAAIGNIKNIWELGRHQHLSVLAAAYAVSKDERFAHRIQAELTHYFSTANFCQGVHWMSGIELGLRMISWTWIRRLLGGWSGASQLFEENQAFRSQLGHHHQWLETFPSHGSSANNHLIAECCGVFVAGSAFELFEDSKRWRDDAAKTLAIEASKQTFNDGLNRELASDYHGFVTELLSVAYVEAASYGHPLAEALRPVLVSSFDALAALCDQVIKPHSQGDADEGHGLLVDPISYDRWGALLRLGDALFGAAPWWPKPPSLDVRTTVLSTMSDHDQQTNDRPTTKPSQFPDAGLTILRTLPSAKPEIWARFDHGPHGYLSTAAHAHADALSIEVRLGGIPILVDPGTYCYHGEPEWRDYFRSTIAHSTVELGGINQSEIGGAFLWRRHCITSLESSAGLDHGDTAHCSAHHSGYQKPFGLLHRRTVELTRPNRRLRFVDQFEGTDQAPPVAARIALHFHPQITVRPDTSTSSHTHILSAPNTTTHGLDTHHELGKLTTDGNLVWSLTKGQTQPPLGWYSHSLGHREPCWVLVGQGMVAAGSSFDTTLTF